MSSYTWFYHVVKGRMGKKTNALPRITATAGEIWVAKSNRDWNNRTENEIQHGNIKMCIERGHLFL